MRLVIIGGSDAGTSAALRAKELEPSAEVIMVVADRFPNYSICGLPFYLSGEVQDWRTLAHRSIDAITAQGVRLLLEHRAQRIDPASKTVTMTDPTGQAQQIAYDRLIIATGAVSARLNIAGLDLPGVYLLRWMDDAFAMQQHLSAKGPRTAIVVGGGYIGLEMADALTRRGLRVTVVEFAPQVMTTVDPALGQLVRAELEQQGVQVMTGVGIQEIERAGDTLLVRGSAGFAAEAGLVVVALGVQPASQLAQSAGIHIGVRGAIQVDRQMRTNVEGIWAAGDCGETWHRLLQKNAYLPLGVTAHKQGRVAGENAVGGQREFGGSLGTQVVKVFDLVIARTGLRDAEAAKEGMDPLSVQLEAWDHKVYYPGASVIHVVLTGDRRTGRLLGAQLIGRVGAEIGKRIDTVATALFNEMRVEQLSDLDLSYTPPLSTPWEPVQTAAQAWMAARGER